MFFFCLIVSVWDFTLDMSWHVSLHYNSVLEIEVELNNSIITIALRTPCSYYYLHVSPLPPSLTGWWLEAWSGLFMSPMCPCASAWPTGSLSLRRRQGADRDPAGSGNLAGGPRDRCRRTSYKTSWGCRRVNVPEPPAGWTPAAVVAGGNRTGWHDPAVAKWARTWCSRSGWCWWTGWNPEVSDLHQPKN